jgi:hypothetical protein
MFEYFCFSIHYFSKVNWLVNTELFLCHKCNTFYLDDDSRIDVV